MLPPNSIGCQIMLMLGTDRLGSVVPSMGYDRRVARVPRPSE
jgi:hypothetical protein